MQNLRRIIDSLNEKPVNKYTMLYGTYELRGITYSIRNVTGGQVKSCEVELKIPRRRFMKEAVLYPTDHTAAAFFIMQSFGIQAILANEAMQQSEDNVQKGYFHVYRTGQRVLPGTFVSIGAEDVCIRMSVRLPSNNSAVQGSLASTRSEKVRRNMLGSVKKGIISSKAVSILLINNLPRLAETFISEFSCDSLAEGVQLYRNQQFIRRQLKKEGYVSFIADGSHLPRKGKTDYRDPRNIVPFQSPDQLKVTFTLPDGEKISGMGIMRGITILTGDAYHGKSTILDAIEQGVYNHCLGDGREYVLTDETAMSIKAEDGRRIDHADISFFLSSLPVESIDPHTFSTDNASGSTSQAAAVAEAVESGCRLMLFDEDRCANNFMYKDAQMKQVIKNPSTTAFVDNARALFEIYGISSILVVGASGEYFRIADRVVSVDRFVPFVFEDYEKIPSPERKISVRKRTMRTSRLREKLQRRDISIVDSETVEIGGEKIRVSDVIPSPSRGQLSFIVCFLWMMTVYTRTDAMPTARRLDEMYAKVKEDIFSLMQDTAVGLGQIEFVRREDMAALLFRMRSMDFR